MSYSRSSSFAQEATADLRQAETEARQRVGGVELDGRRERSGRLVYVHAREPSEAEDGLGPGESGVQALGALRGVESALGVAERRADLGQARPRQRVVRRDLDGPLERCLGALEIEAPLSRVRLRDQRASRRRVCRNGGVSSARRRRLVVLCEGDDRA
jgi:hypothetical protein